MVDMTSIWNRWFMACRGVRIILAFSYLFVTFIVPLTHTCHPVDKDVYCHRSEYASHRYGYLTESKFVFGWSNYDNTNRPHSTCCLACLYSIISKTFNPYLGTSLCLIQTVIKTQVLPQLSFTKQFERLSSLSLRAPPGITF